jgi:hypothetical protein
MKSKSLAPNKSRKKIAPSAKSIEQLYIAITTKNALRIFGEDREKIAIIEKDGVKILQIISFLNKNISHIRKLDNDFWELSIWQSSPIRDDSSLLELSLLSLLTKNPTPDSVYILDPLENRKLYKDIKYPNLFEDRDISSDIGFNEAVRVSSLLYEAQAKSEKAYFESKFESGKFLKANGAMPFQGYGEILGYSFYFWYKRGVAELYLSEYVGENPKTGVSAYSKPLYFSSTKYPKPNGRDGELSFGEFTALFSILLKSLEKTGYDYKFKYIGHLEEEDPDGYYPEVNTIRALSVAEAQKLLANEPTASFYDRIPLNVDDRVFPEVPYDFASLVREIG